jgi:hypothetical protein
MADAAPVQHSVNPRKICWLVSFPKSGNTWTRILLSNLIAADKLGEDDLISLNGSISSNRPSFDTITGLPSSDLTDDEVDLLRPEYYRRRSEQFSSQMFVKVHDAYHANASGEPIFPADCSHGAIYLVRHPYDVAVSYAHHQGHSDYDRAIDQLNDREHLLAGGGRRQLRQRTMGWGGHYRSWHEQSAIPVLTVRYEDMLADTAAALAIMARFIGVAEQQDTAAILRAVEASRFERLREIEDRVGFQERPVRSQRFFRSGRAGDGRRLLSEAQRARIFDPNRALLEELGYTREQVRESRSSSDPEGSS